MSSNGAPQHSNSTDVRSKWISSEQLDDLAAYVLKLSRTEASSFTYLDNVPRHGLGTIYSGIIRFYKKGSKRIGWIINTDNYAGKHWIACCWSIDDNILTVVDPLSDRLKDDKFLERLESLGEKVRNCLKIDDKWQIIPFNKVLQEDEYNCGIISLYLLWNLLLGQNIRDNDFLRVITTPMFFETIRLKWLELLAEHTTNNDNSIISSQESYYKELLDMTSHNKSNEQSMNDYARKRVSSYRDLNFFLPG